MFTLWKIALLDDDVKHQKKHLEYLKKIKNVEIIIVSNNSNEFFESVKTSSPDILITDLDLGADVMSGLEVAQEIKLPVFFTSDISNVVKYIREVEDLKREIDAGVDHITKPYKEDEFVKSFSRFLKEVEYFSKKQYIYLDFSKTKNNKIFIDDIVYLYADKNEGSKSNNKIIHFINRKKENLIDFSFSKMEDRKLMKTQFITIHRAFRVNKNHIKCYHKDKSEIEVEVYDENNKTKCHKLKVSENYQKVIKQMFS